MNTNLLIADAAERNKQPILDVLKTYLPPTGAVNVLEIASGTGQHVAHFAVNLPHVTWQPTDITYAYLQSISAHIELNKLTNVLQPLNVDITLPHEHWNMTIKQESHDLIYNSNMVHISPWETSKGLFRSAGYLLKKGGILFMYGPFKINGVLTPESNVRFNEYLISQDVRWGVRDIVDLEILAKEYGLSLEKMFDMPANNTSVIFRKCTR
ncbi:Methyltransferase-like 26 [Bulinus truncatus]|nr:Methyltransferase-like 26 [Bulinus truncatus]